MSKPSGLLIIFTVLCCFACGKEEVPYREGDGKIFLKSDFVSKKINKFLLYTTGYQDYSPQEAALLSPAEFRKHGSGKVLALGTTLRNHYAWLRFELVNRSHAPHRLTVLTDHTRCDKLELFRAGPQGAELIGEIDRVTPISGRHYAYDDFALPVNLAPGESAVFLLRTTRRQGATELNVWLYEERAFLVYEYKKGIWNAFHITFVTAITLLALVIGLMYRHRLMLTLSGFAGCFVLLYSYVLGYWDGMEIPGPTGLKSHNLGGFLAFSTNAFFHFYGNELLKNYHIRVGWYRWFAKTHQIANSIMMVIILIPVRIDALYIYGFWILTLFALFCFIYVAWLIYWQAGVKWVMAVVITAIGPTLFDIVRQLFGGEMQEMFFGMKLFNEGLVTAMLGYFTLRQLLYELTSRAQVDQAIMETKMHMDEIRKEEVQKIGRGLHDQVGNTLASLLGYLNAGKGGTEKVKMLVVEAIKEIRFMSHNLVKDDELPLTDKIAHMVERFNEFSEISFQYNDYSGGRAGLLTTLQQQNIYLIIQEAFTNAIRHSDAQEVTLQVFAGKNKLQISIDDDGKGFDPGTATGGLGVRNMKKRADLAQLKLSVDAAPAHGVSIIIEADYEDQNHDY